MGGKKLLVIVGLLLALLIVPVFFVLGVVDVSRFSLISAPASSTVESTSSSSTPLVFVDPAQNITDYEDPEHNVTIGSTVTFHINISDVTDLFTWNVNITWNPAILNFSRVKEYGPFLRATTSPNGTSGWIDRDPTKNVTIAPFNNTVGYAAIAETILGEYPGINGSGRLVTIEFLIVGYGHTNLTISVSGTLPTILLNSTDGTITYSRTGGYFRNTIPGDMVGDTAGTPPDGDVDRYDFGEFADAYGSRTGDPNYNILADLVGDTVGSPLDGDVDRYDFGIFADNYGRSI